MSASGGPRPTRPQWPGLYNVRDLGGLPTASGFTVARRVVRSEAPIQAAPAAIAAIADYGVVGFVDLRSAEEAAEEATPFGTRSGYRLVPLLDESQRLVARQSAGTQELLENLLLCHGDRVAAALRAVIEVGCSGAVMVHCRAGKDRTGAVVAVLLALTGVPDEVIAADFAASGAVLEEQIRAWGETAGVDSAALWGMRHFVPTEDHMLAALKALRIRFGSPAAYLRHGGLNDREIERLQGLLVGGRD